MGKNWTIHNITVGNVAGPQGPYKEPAPTKYHSPFTARTIMGGPGNRSSIRSCSCGARFDGVYEYIGRESRMNEWYARHAGIEGGGDKVARILVKYDAALDARDHSEYAKCIKRAKDLSVDLRMEPNEILRELRRENP